MLQFGALFVYGPATASLLCAEDDSTKLPLMTSIKKRVSSKLGPTHIYKVNIEPTLKKKKQ